MWALGVGPATGAGLPDVCAVGLQSGVESDAVDVCDVSPARGRASSSPRTGMLLRGVSLAMV